MGPTIARGPHEKHGKLDGVIAEAAMLALLKSALTAGGSAWAVLLVEGDWATAAFVLVPLALCGLLLWHHSHRPRGTRAESPP